MNATIRALACLVVSASAVVAESPPPVRVVVLDNENLLEGEVARVEGGYQIRGPLGGEVTLPTNRVLAVVADRKAAFAVVTERANRRDPDERLRLARWCVTNGLTDEALTEARTAARMRPGFTAAEQLVRALESAARIPAAAPEPKVVPAAAVAPAKDTVTEVPAIDYNSESYPLFASKVNAILMNACAACHARDDVKAFHLNRLGGRAGTTKNLMSALAQVNSAEPATSLLLVKAVTAHGSATEAPLKSRSHPAYQTLEIWARSARAPEGTAVPEAPLPIARPAEPRKLPDLGPERIESSPPDANKDAFGQDSKPTRPQARDEFDPAIFNEQAKPKK